MKLLGGFRVSPYPAVFVAAHLLSLFLQRVSGPEKEEGGDTGKRKNVFMEILHDATRFNPPTCIPLTQVKQD